MQKNIAHILVIGLLACLFAACSDNVDAPVQESHPVQVGFTLSTGGGYGSRASHGAATDESGTGFENYIDVVGRDFRFYIFDKDSKFVDELKTLMVMPMDNSEYPTTYHVTGELNDIPPADESFKVVAITSWDSYPTDLEKGVTTIDDVCEASKYNYKRPFIPSKTHKIPMYGVMTHEAVEFKPNLNTDLGTIDMLRAMAKVEVKFAEGIPSAYTLKSVQLHNFTAHGMAAPKGVDTNTPTECNDLVHALHMDHEYTVNTTPLDFPITENRGMIIYIPEYKNVDFEAPSYITVTIGHGDHTKDYNIYFRNYENGKPKDGEQIDIVRNHHYLFTITKVGGNIEVNYTVADWIHDEDKHHWEQTFAYPTYLNLRPWDQRTVEIETQIQYPAKPTMYFDANDEEKGAFVVGFKMTGPTGQTWAPAIHGTETGYVLKVYNDRGDVLSNNDDWVASENWYQIKLIPQSPDGVGNIVDFGISTTLNWEDRSMFLLINGEDEHTIRWPDSGNDARLIRVKQIAAPSSNNGNNENEDNT